MISWKTVSSQMVNKNENHMADKWDEMKWRDDETSKE